MPRLNHGTLLENLVVLDVTRYVFEKAQGDVEFASAFSMPPMTQCWHKDTTERTNNPRFNDVVLECLAGAGPQKAGSYAEFLQACLLASRGGTTVCAYQPQMTTPLATEFGGPSGALLAAMHSTRANRDLRMWSNDFPARKGRYWNEPPSHADAATECPKTIQYSGRLLAASPRATSTSDFAPMAFPSSASLLASWVRSVEARVGFLDPDTYVGASKVGPARITSADHCDWLRALSSKAASSVGIMFFANQDNSKQGGLVAQFHQDEMATFPRSLVFVHGRFLVGVKASDGDFVTSDFADIVSTSWAEWSANPCVDMPPDKLRVAVDGAFPSG